MADSSAFRGFKFNTRRRSFRRVDQQIQVPVGDSVPTTFAGLFGPTLAHLWNDDYDSTTGTWPDSVGGVNVDNVSATIPDKLTINGHDYPSFDGALDSLKGTDISTLDGRSSYCIFAAVRLPADAYGAILGKSDSGIQFALEIDSPGGMIYAYVNNGSQDITGAISIDDDLWHRVILNVVGNAATLYIDGVSDGTNTFATVSAFPGSNLYIGNKTNNPLLGEVAVVGIANTGLTPTQVGYLDDIIDDWIGNP